MKTRYISILIFFWLPVQLIAQQENDKMPDGKITVASCQFPVSADIHANLKWITKQMTEAKTKKATIVHFPECALSGYPGTDMTSIDNFNWKELGVATDSILSLAKKLQLWVILGSM